MIPEQLPTIVFFIIKLLVLAGLVIYVIFSAIMVRQEQLMAHVLEEAYEGVLKILAVIHCAAAVALFFLALIIL